MFYTKFYRTNFSLIKIKLLFKTLKITYLIDFLQPLSINKSKQFKHLMIIGSNGIMLLFFRLTPSTDSSKVYAPVFIYKIEIRNK